MNKKAIRFLSYLFLLCPYARALEVKNKGNEAIFKAAESYRDSKKRYKEKEPFLSQKQLPLDLEGWFNHTSQECAQQLIQKINPKIIVDIGVWKGLTTLFFAINTDPNAKIYAIDLFGTQPLLNPDNILVADANISRIFMSNMKYFKVGEKIVPVAFDSLLFVQHLDSKVDLVHVCGDHSEDGVYKNIIAWSEKLSDNGIICGGAYQWPGGSVASAVKNAALYLGKTVQCVEGFWWLERKFIK